jgi:hypothetical protein
VIVLLELSGQISLLAVPGLYRDYLHWIALCKEFSHALQPALRHPRVRRLTEFGSKISSQLPFGYADPVCERPNSVACAL